MEQLCRTDNNEWLWKRPRKTRAVLWRFNTQKKWIAQQARNTTKQIWMTYDKFNWHSSKCTAHTIHYRYILFRTLLWWTLFARTPGGVKVPKMNVKVLFFDHEYTKWTKQCCLNKLNGVSFLAHLGNHWNKTKKSCLRIGRRAGILKKRNLEKWIQHFHHNEHSALNSSTKSEWDGPPPPPPRVGYKRKYKHERQNTYWLWQQWQYL